MLQTVDDYASLARLKPWRAFALRGGWQSAAAAPIRRAGELFAVLFLVSGDNAVSDGDTRRMISQLANNMGRALDEIDLKAALRAKREHQSMIARHDKLTNLPNRRAFEETLPLSLAHASRHAMVLGIGMLDLDNFKQINERFGHAGGDTVLRTLARRLRGALRCGTAISWRGLAGMNSPRSSMI
ncbi:MULTISPECIES: sensor domain-containing diguanylate cyclase [Acidiphilium]|uniref:GGDEF domain-containing protein n=1 Tax=Acidiphilium TaxID=522 RepID=UPI00257E8428|nr:MULTISPECIES: sensor domain-containing diguanylate cyclase [Acidiphilium]HQT83625.1 sensor domain-containing diguanylate cyclase [Acidiphilium rubrum]